MLNRNYRHVIIGDNYLSYLLGLMISRWEESVLVVEDPAISFGETFLNNVGELEVSYLKSLGKLMDCLPLLNIERYLVPKLQIYSLANASFCLGHPSFYRNLRECFRKLGKSAELIKYCPNSFREDFDALMEEVVTNVSELAVRSRKFDFSAEKEFVAALENPLKKIYFQLKSFFSQNGSDGAALNFLLQGQYFSTYQGPLADSVFFFFFLQLLSPRYELNSLKLQQDLASELELMGGHRKLAKIQSWQVKGPDVHGLLLASFEGMIRPNQVCAVGQLPLGHPLASPSMDQQVFPLIAETAGLFSDCESPLQILSLRRDEFGDASQVSELRISPNRKTQFLFFVPHQIVTGPHYFEQTARASMTQLLQTISPRQVNALGDRPLNFRKGFERRTFHPLTEKALQVKNPWASSVPAEREGRPNFFSVGGDPNSLFPLLQQIKSFPAAWFQ